MRIQPTSIYSTAVGSDHLPHMKSYVDSYIHINILSFLIKKNRPFKTSQPKTLTLHRKIEWTEIYELHEMYRLYGLTACERVYAPVPVPIPVPVPVLKVSKTRNLSVPFSSNFSLIVNFTINSTMGKFMS